MEIICSHELCTGCQACKAGCPTDAIEMLQNRHGHIYPAINQEKCIDCGKCQRICPALNTPEFFPKQDIAYACWSKTPQIRKESVSGGLSYELSRRFVADGGVFFGVVWNKERQDVMHTSATSIDELAQFQGSKYGHSDVNDTYKQVKKHLSCGRKVLYSGTACQLAGLIAFLGNRPDGLYLVEVLCHGAPSKALLMQRISEIEDKFESHVSGMTSRKKSPNQYQTDTAWRLDIDSEYCISFYHDPYAKCFVQNYSLRPNCYSCRYARAERIADLTLADFWGYIPTKLKMRSFEKGTSLVLINSAKGQELFLSISGKLTIDVRPFSEAQNGNQNLSAPQPRPKNLVEFWNDFEKGLTVSQLAEKYCPSKIFRFSFKDRIVQALKMTLPASVIAKLKKLVKS